MSSTSKEGLLALCSTFLGLSVISVTLRLYVRKQERIRLFIDDWCAVLGVACFVGSCVVVFLFVRYKVLGYSSSDFTTGQTTAMNMPSGMLGHAFNFINTTTLAAIKLSAVFFYRRIFVTGAFPHERFNRITLGLAIIVICWYITYMFLAAFQCPGHFDAVEKGEGVQYCSLNFSWALGLAISDFVLDLIVLLLPIPQIWRLRIDTAKKLSIVGVFALAFVGLGASIARLDFYVRDQGGRFWSRHDFERMYTQIIYIQMLEAGVSVTAVNFPCLWGLFSTRLPARIANGLRSLRSLGSTDKSGPRGSSSRSSHHSDEETKTGCSVTENNRSSTTDSIRDATTGPLSLPRPAILRSDLEGQTYVAYATRRPEDERSRPVFAHGENSIRADRSVEIRHE